MPYNLELPRLWHGNRLDLLPGITDFIYDEGRQRALLLGLTGLKFAARRIGKMLIIDMTLIQFMCLITPFLHYEIKN
jgi:hypothetical protein